MSPHAVAALYRFLGNLAVVLFGISPLIFMVWFIGTYVSHSPVL